MSNSWLENDYGDITKIFSDEELKQAANDGWYLLKYECLNSPTFELYNRMKLR